jgi:DNA-binding beta-propeller fold protein YncE
VLVIVRLLDSHRLWSELRVLDPDTLNVRKVIPLEHTARTVCVSADGSRAFVTTGSVNSREDYLNSAVYVIDVNAGAVTKAVTLGNRGPWGAAVLSLETGALVAAATDSVSVIDTSSLAVIGTVSVPHECTALAMSPDGTEVIVAARHTGFPGSSNTATVIDIGTCAIAGSVTLDFEPTVVDNMSGYIPVGSAIFTPDNVRALISQLDTKVFSLRRVPTGGIARS